MQYKKTTKPAKTIAAELGVSHIVEGSVRRAGNRLRIVAQLIDAASDGNLWAQTFDRDLVDVFAIQTEVAEKITAALESRLTRDERARIAKPPTQDLEAYNLFVLGRHHYRSGTSDGFPKAARCFEEAIARDPRFAKAYGWLALVHMYQGPGYWGVRPHDAWARGLPMAKTALELDPDIAEAHHALAIHASWIAFDHASATTHIERALALNPNDAFAYNSLALIHAGYGNTTASAAALAKEVELDPTSALLQLNAVVIHWVLRRFDDAAARFKIAREIHPSYPYWAVIDAMIVVGASGRRGESSALADVAVQPLDNFMSFMVAMHLAAFGDHAAARARLADLHAREATEYVWATGFAIVYGYLGELDRAFEYLERAYDDRAGWMTLLTTAPCFDPLRGDSRFEAVVARVGLVSPPSARLGSTSPRGS